MPKGRRQRVILALGLVTALAYAGLSAVPKKVSFSYASAPCTGSLTIFPSMHRAVDSANFKLEYRGGGGGLFATKICFVPVAPPKPAVTRVASAPFGGWLFREKYELYVGDAPRLMDAAPKPRAMSQPLDLKLSQADGIYRYHLEAEGNQQACTTTKTGLECGLDKLGLKQGASAAVQLQRSFNGKPAGQPVALTVAILPASIVTAASIKPDETIYTKIKNADFTLDKPLVAADAKLEQVDGDKLSIIKTSVKTDSSKVLVSWDQDLPREKAFRLTLTSANASDGSATDGPHIINFRTSGGPQVAGISIGASGVAASERVVVTFDQSLVATSDIVKLASISGGSAAITRQGSNQLVFALRDLPRCQEFTLKIAKGAMGEGGAATAQDWSHTARVSCRTVKTIGHSVQGRPIQAYFYGSGASTVLFTGGIHGEEFSGMYIMQDWVAHLDANAHKIPAGRQIVVVPNLNPDGIARGQRYNVNNVNLDRNFPSSDWISDITAANGLVPRGGGVTPLSEPEARAIANLIGTLKIRAAISFHASGALVGANKVGDSVVIGSRYAAGVGYGTMFENPEAIMGYTLTGELETWMGEKYGIPAILIEMPTSKGRFFNRHLNTLWSMVNL